MRQARFINGKAPFVTILLQKRNMTRKVVSGVGDAPVNNPATRWRVKSGFTSGQQQPLVRESADIAVFQRPAGRRHQVFSVDLGHFGDRGRLIADLENAVRGIAERSCLYWSQRVRSYLVRLSTRWCAGDSCRQTRTFKYAKGISGTGE